MCVTEDFKNVDCLSGGVIELFRSLPNEGLGDAGVLAAPLGLVGLDPSAVTSRR